MKLNLFAILLALANSIIAAETDGIPTPIPAEKFEYQVSKYFRLSK